MLQLFIVLLTMQASVTFVSSKWLLDSFANIWASLHCTSEQEMPTKVLTNVGQSELLYIKYNITCFSRQLGVPLVFRGLFPFPLASPGS